MIGIRHPSPDPHVATAIVAGELVHLIPDAAAGDGANPFSLAGTVTIFPGCCCCCCLARSPPPEETLPSPRRPGDRLALQLPLPLSAPGSRLKSLLRFDSERLLQAKDLSGLLLRYSSPDDAEGIEKLATLAKEHGKKNVASLCLFMLGKLEDCIQLLVDRV